MTFKKIIALMLALILTSLVFAACGKQTAVPGNSSQSGGKETSSGADDIVIRGDEGPSNVGTPDKTLDPKSVYASLSYVPEMFYGDYQLPGKKEDVQKKAAALPLVDFKDDYSEQITLIPHRIRAGDNSFNHIINYIREYHWLEAQFLNEKQNLKTVICAYSVEGHTLTLRPITYWKYIEEENKGVYEFSDETFTYEFSFSGTTLTLSKDGSSLTLDAALDAYGEKPYIHMEGYLSGDEAAGNISGMRIRWNPTEKNDASFSNTMLLEDGSAKVFHNGVVSLSKDGLMTLTVQVDDAGTVKTVQYMYFYCCNDGFILTDGNTNYYYNNKYSSGKMTNRLAGSIKPEEREKMEDLDEAQLTVLLEKKEDLLDELTAAFSDAGIQVDVNRENGELAMDATVLFGGDSAVLTQEGKDFLNKFIAAYAKIACSEKYRDFIRSTAVEGHIAPVTGVTYEGGLPLSEERAGNVLNYCLSADAGLSADEVSILKEKLFPVGFSNLRPVMKADGTPDMEASRRVSFRFLINLDALN